MRKVIVVDGVATGTDLGVEGAIYEKDTNRYNPAGEPNPYQSNTNFGLPKVYQSTLDSIVTLLSTCIHLMEL